MISEKVICSACGKKMVVRDPDGNTDFVALSGAYLDDDQQVMRVDHEVYRAKYDD